MCNSPDCRHPYICTQCHAECNEDETLGCHECISGRIIDKMAEMAELVAEAQGHQDDGHPVRVMMYGGISPYKIDVLPKLKDLVFGYEPELRRRAAPR